MSSVCDERDANFLGVQDVEILVKDPRAPDTVVLDVLLRLSCEQMAPVILSSRKHSDILERLQCLDGIVGHGLSLRQQHVSDIGEATRCCQLRKNPCERLSWRQPSDEWD